MKSLVKVRRTDGDIELINEEVICSVRPAKNGNALIELCSGRIIEVMDPAFDQWENDLFVRRE